ncbi:GAF domain-containing sensor histidine kinase [Allocoleopsis franciscana]|nr:ATP-binding protein [Allocoleopsis franciscana]
MLQSIQDFFSGNFMAHGYCFLWKPELVWLHAGSDFLIGLAYYSIPLMLLYFVRQRQDVPFQGIFLLFSAFILSCGTGHLLEILTLWHPVYWLSGLMKAITAIVSLYTASELVPLIPQALALPSPAQLEAANIALEKEIVERKEAENALRQAKQELEQRVEERTRELARANQVLQSEIIERELAELALAERERYLAALAEVQHSLLSLKGDKNYYTSILELLGQSAKASHVYVFENFYDTRGELWSRPCAQWYVPHLYSEGDSAKCPYLPYETCLPRWTEILARGETIMGLVSEFPEEERFTLEQMGILSLLVLPLCVNDQFFGFIVFDNCTKAKVWSASAVDLLRAAAAALSLQHERFKAEVALRHSEAQLREQATQLEQALNKIKQTQTQLVQSEKMYSLGMMVAGIAHEINNPVGFVYGNITPASESIQDLLTLVNLYRQHYPNPVPVIQEYEETIDLDFIMDDLPKLLQSMKVGAERIRDIVASLRTFSRTDQSQMKRVNIHEGLDTTLQILQHRLKKKPGRPAIEVIKKYGRITSVECYSGQINQVFMNILANAIDALESMIISSEHIESETMVAHPSPQIQIYTELIDARESISNLPSVVIRIIDNGPGMTERVRLLLFDPFFTTKPIGQGTGLGLSISYQIIVAKHGGQIRCVSAPGQGTEFIIEIPIRQCHRKFSPSRQDSSEPQVLPAKNWQLC